MESDMIKADVYGKYKVCTICNKIIKAEEDKSYIEVNQQALMYEIDKNAGLVEIIPAAIRQHSEVFCEKCFQLFVEVTQDFFNEKIEKEEK